MILYYEVYEKGTSWQGVCFPTLIECNEYIEGQTILSEQMYTKGRTKDDYEIIPHTYCSVEDLLRDEYGDDKCYERYLKEKYPDIY